MSHWTLEDIPWESCDHNKVTPELLSLAKAACMVEHNSADYARYLCEVFHDDPEFQQAARDWALEEIQHGEALKRWSQLADPSFDFDKSFRAFIDGYKIPTDVNASVRGSRTGELIARCVVEAGTSSYYSAIRDFTDEPVLKAICAKIAADEFRHYKLFYSYLNRYVKKDNMSLWARLRVALGRIAESEDDELAYAYFAAHGKGIYDRKTDSNRYLARACMVYRKWHIEKMIAMVLKAAGLKPNGRLSKFAGNVAWKLMQMKRWMLREYAAA